MILQVLEYVVSKLQSMEFYPVILTISSEVHVNNFNAFPFSLHVKPFS